VGVLAVVAVVVVRHHLPDEQRGEEREQVRLQKGDEQLQAHDRHRAQDRRDADATPPTAPGRRRPWRTKPMITASRMCPAVMFAASRTASENGFTSIPGTRRGT
jgi:hypothetical protein